MTKWTCFSDTCASKLGPQKENAILAFIALYILKLKELTSSRDHIQD